MRLFSLFSRRFLPIGILVVNHEEGEAALLVVGWPRGARHCTQNGGAPFLRLTRQRLHPLQQALPGLRGRGGRASGAAVGSQVEAEVTLLLLRRRRHPDRRRARGRARLLLGRRGGLLLGRRGPHLAFALIVKLGGKVPRGEPAL
jgi:hypothetical protein